WTSVLAQVGAFKRRGAPRSVEQKGTTLVAIPCEFDKGILEVLVAMNAAGKISGLSIRPPAVTAAPYAPPPYVDPSKYAEREVKVGTAPWELPGTLTMPTGAGPFPAVILIHGSGPNDRDETIGPNKPFKDLALGLASRGIAVLRYEKRSRQYGAQAAAVENFTVKQEVIDDVVAAAALLRKTAGINPTRIVAVGHSLGAMLIPRIAQADPQLDGLVMLSAPTTGLDETIVRQTRYLADADGKVSSEEQKQIDATVAVADAVRRLMPSDRLAGVTIGGIPASYWLDLRGYDVAKSAAALKQPMLILQGERDYQITMDDFAKLRAALGTKPGVTLRSYPDLNHLLIAGEGKSMPVEYTRAGHVAEDVVRDIAAWIASTIK
ncbi:MAG TPA: alpha/beta fold hydrolase, partial [Vicinamibacterales bacterium]|nr:alpha/beta fold hydrolase [Vicinamibacterales bacterium]